MPGIKLTFSITSHHPLNSSQLFALNTFRESGASIVKQGSKGLPLRFASGSGIGPKEQEARARERDGFERGAEEEGYSCRWPEGVRTKKAVNHYEGLAPNKPRPMMMSRRAKHSKGQTYMISNFSKTFFADPVILVSAGSLLDYSGEDNQYHPHFESLY